MDDRNDEEEARIHQVRLKETGDYIKLCRREGVRFLRLGSLEMEIELDHPRIPPGPPTADPPRKLTTEEQQEAEDELLYHSSDPVG